ncbi:hypothetical protein, partial [Klebsiella pneumoniae]|uniref:hypothetical protein n=1 Tax=Klebsiella pneumoniae TaxID=573 RepID=UPI003013737C
GDFIRSSGCPSLRSQLRPEEMKQVEEEQRDPDQAAWIWSNTARNGHSAHYRQDAKTKSPTT